MSTLDHPNKEIASHKPFLSTPTALVPIGFLAIAAFFLVTEHTAHLFGILAWLLLLACPLMHLFMHHGHGGHGSGSDRTA